MANHISHNTFYYQNFPQKKVELDFWVKRKRTRGRVGARGFDQDLHWSDYLLLLALVRHQCLNHIYVSCPHIVGDGWMEILQKIFV